VLIERGIAMTLAVSLRVPDGVIIAADSLLTTTGHIGVSAEWRGQCPKCQEDVELKDIKLPPLQIPASLSSFAQKVFPFKDYCGVATYGTAILNEKTIYYHVKMLEKKHKDDAFDSVTEASKVLLDYFDKEIRKQIKDLDKAPLDFVPLGLLVAGYDGGEGKTLLIKIGKKSRTEKYKGSGCTYGGYGDVVVKLWELSKSDPRRSTAYGSFSLQDAVDYAEYIITTTANFQRFANMIPSVGGEVDIGLITPFRKFTWIKCKTLTLTVEEEKWEGGHNDK